MEEPAFPSYLSLLGIVLQSSGTGEAKVFINSPRGNFFVPLMSFGDVCGKELVCELSFQ